MVDWDETYVWKDWHPILAIWPRKVEGHWVWFKYIERKDYLYPSHDGGYEEFHYRLTREMKERLGLIW